MKALYHLMSTVSAVTIALHQCNIPYVRHLAEKTVNSRIASIYYYNLRIVAENVLTLDSLQQSELQLRTSMETDALVNCVILLRQT